MSRGLHDGSYALNKSCEGRMHVYMARDRRGSVGYVIVMFV
jgi:hypothetical protein